MTNFQEILIKLGMEYANYFVLLIVVGVLLVMWKRGHKATVIQALRYLITKAEDELGSKTGQVKKAKVISEFYQRLPFLIVMLFSEEDISEMIDRLVDEMDEFLKNRADEYKSIDGEVS